MSSEPWLEDLSEDWDEEDAPWPTRPAGIGLELESLRSSRRHGIEIEHKDHRHSSSDPSPQARETRWASRRLRDRGFTVDETSPSKRLPNLHMNRRSTLNTAKRKDAEKETGEKKQFIDDDYDLDDMWDEGGSVVQHQHDEPDDFGTTQIKARRTPTTYDEENMPEWKKRLMNGEKVNDLFIQKNGIETLFDAPPEKDMDAQDKNPGLSKRFASMKLGELDEPLTKTCRDEKPGAEKNQRSPMIKKYKRRSSYVSKATSDSEADSPAGSYDSRRLTASGMEELRNESLTPIRINIEGASTVLIEDEPEERPLGARKHLAVDAIGQSRLVDHFDSLDITSHFLPEDLTMGTPDIVRSTSRTRFRQEDRSVDAGKLKSNSRSLTRPVTPSPPRLEPSLSPSSFVSNPKTRGSPEAGSPRRTKSDSPQRNPATSPNGLQRRSEEIMRPHALLSQEMLRPNSTPLKLFGNHDTFTNNKLLRRLSQLDREDDAEHPKSTSNASRKQHPRSKSHIRGQSAPDYIGQKQGNRSRPSSRQSQDSDGPARTRRARSRTAGPSLTPPPPSPPTPTDCREQRHIRPKTAMSDRNGPRDLKPLLRLPTKEKKAIVTSSPDRSPNSSPARSPTPLPRRQKTNRPTTPLPQVRSPESKRLLYSPTKDSTPKRRRTSSKVTDSLLWKSPIINATPFKAKPGTPQKKINDNMLKPPTRLKHSKPQSPTPLSHELSDGKSSPSGDSRVDDAEFSHSIEVLKQRFGDKFCDEFSRLDDNRKGSITTGDFLQEATKVMDLIRAKGKIQGTPGLASVLESAQDDDEEASDRREEEPLEDVEGESGEGGRSSPTEQFTRPSSRKDGHRLSKLGIPAPNQRILSHLEKFADDSEAEQLDLSPSVSSLHLADNRHRNDRDSKQKGNERLQRPTRERKKRLSETRVAQVKREASSGSIIASPANIRIRERSRNCSDESVPPKSQKSFNSQVYGRSHASIMGAKGLIPGDKVSHLIPKNVGSMVLDQTKRQWVRDQSRPNSRQQEVPVLKLETEKLEMPNRERLRPWDAAGRRNPNDACVNANMDCSKLSEDDPFRDISDLSVDEAEEMNMVRSAVDSRPGNFTPTATGNAAGKYRVNDIGSDDETLHPTQELNATCSRPNARDDDEGFGSNMEAASIASASLDSQQSQPEPREPSWGSDMTGTTRRSEGRTSSSYVAGASASRSATNNSSTLTHQSKSDRGSRAPTAIGSAHEIKREKGNDECDANGTPIAHSKSSYPDKQARVVTITMPSPSRANKYRDRNREAYPKWEEPAIAEEMTQEKDNLTDGKGSPMKAKMKSSRNNDCYHKENYRPTPTADFSAKSTRFAADKNGLSHPPSFERRDFKGRPISKIDEERSAEESMLLQGNELSVIPMGQPSCDLHYQQRGSAVPTPEKSYSFHLNTLPEFTLHQVDERDTELGTVRREFSFIGRRAQPSSLRQIHGNFALGSEQLVKCITDVAENELEWERIRRLDLSNKQIVGTQKLEQLCPKLEELDLSHNQLAQTLGIPQSVRMLGLRHNLLNDLTSWGHLKNLQYLDVSNNDLESLDMFAEMVHLRSLKANNNNITRLGKVVKLDGLLALHLRGNQLLEVDFHGTTWTRMTALDLRENHIQRVKHIERLSSLEKLDMSYNDLTTFGADMPLPRLRTLKLSHNLLTHLDTAGFSELRLLYADDNNLRTIYGLGHCRRLEALSIREQVLPEFEDQAPLTIDLDVSCVPGLRKLHLSANRLGKHVLRPRKPMPGLQFLDISCCGLETLPPDLGQKFPSLRALNINFNAVVDLSGLTGVTRLIRLLAAGNRIGGLRSICSILKEVGGRHGSLRCVDLRDNPMTVGFYPAHTFTAPDSRAMTLHRKPSAFEPTSKGTDESRVKDPYALPPIDTTTDDRYVRRLDDGTRTRRRVVHCLINVSAGSRLKLLDGLDVSGVDPIGLLEDVKEKRGGGEEDVWRRLIELGVVRKKRSADSAVSGVMTDVTGSTETIATGLYASLNGSGSDFSERKTRQRVK
ncbi:hypothetical protein KEM56_006547 [Ascosphaera pollenicola]|nr:hypothetical protein KEM56_006547 [Ascosphaera pollenicola]